MPKIPCLEKPDIYRLKIKERCAQLKITMEQLAGTIGVSRVVISQWSNGRRFPTNPEHQIKLTRSLQCLTEELLHDPSVDGDSLYCFHCNAQKQPQDESSALCRPCYKKYERFRIHRFKANQHRQETKAVRDTYTDTETTQVQICKECLGAGDCSNCYGTGYVFGNITDKLGGKAC